MQGNRLAQYGWILVLALVVLALDIGIDLRGEEVWEKIKGRIPPGDVQMRVTAQRFTWGSSTYT